MVNKKYIPNKGDFVWLSFGPRRGREQGGRRPALVMSAQFYNRATGLAIVCPVTSKVKGYSFEVFLSEGKISGSILADHVHSLDWKRRRAIFIQRAHVETVENVINKIFALVGDKE